MSITFDKVIRRYENRKLYNTTDSKYVSTADVLDMVVLGQKVQVLANVGGENVIRSVLFSALFEKSRLTSVDDKTIVDLAQKVTNYFNGGI